MLEAEARAASKARRRGPLPEHRPQPGERKAPSVTVPPHASEPRADAQRDHRPRRTTATRSQSRPRAAIAPVRHRLVGQAGQVDRGPPRQEPQQVVGPDPVPLVGGVRHPVDRDTGRSAARVSFLERETRGEFPLAEREGYNAVKRRGSEESIAGP